ncbi:MAG TPA: cyanophycinase [Bacteroidia bacterium]|jgi:cyanophycinase|nr:cyanophycinase [Bacteroidia bacterium]
MIKGTLIPIGGNEDKGMGENEMYTLEFLKEGILSHVVRESGGERSRIVVIPTASSIPHEVGKNYLHAFDKLGVNHVEVMHIHNRDESERTDYLRSIEQADCVMFSGGDQSHIVDRIGGTKMHQILLERYQKDDFVIAGTSAGAMCMSSEMIAGGSVTESLFKGSVRMRNGMGFIPELIIDSHFIQRGRFGRLAEAVAKFPHLMGVGLAEDTGLIIKNCNDFKVIGSGMVVLFDPSKLTHNNVEILETGTPMSMSNLVVHILSNSDQFVVDQRRIEILPLDAAFI